MNHPFIHQTNHRIMFLILWSVVTSGQVMVLLSSGETGFVEALVDGLVYNLLLMIFSITPWYMLNAMGGSFSTRQLLVNVLLPGLILIGLWLFLAYQIMLLLFPDPAYQQFAAMAVPYRVIYGLLLYTIVVMVYLLHNSFHDMQIKNQRMNELSNLVRDSEINALKAQINPHFLFNSLNSIASLTMFDPSKAREMVIKLSEYMRYIIRRNEKELMTLEDEMANINRYLDIEMTRFGDRIEVHTQMPANCSKLLIPNMVLQPIFENAIKHGVHESDETVRIITHCKETEEGIKIVIANNFDPIAPTTTGKGIGLENIRRRLNLTYNRSDLLQYEKLGNLFTVILTFPQLKPGND